MKRIAISLLLSSALAACGGTPYTPPTTAPTPTPTTPTPTNPAPTTPAKVTNIETVKNINEDEKLRLTVKLEGEDSNDSVAFKIEGITKDDYGDLTFDAGVKQNADGTLSIPKGVKEFTITLPILADQNTEGNETAKFTIGEKDVDVTINDTSKDPAKVTSVTAKKDSINEGEKLELTVTLDTDSGNDSVSFTIAGTVDDKDYGKLDLINSKGVTQNPDGSLKVPKGVKEFTITLPITADKKTEPTETATITVGDAETTVTINDTSKDPAKVVSVTAKKDSINEGEDLELIVKLDTDNGNDSIPFTIAGTVSKEDYTKFRFDPSDILHSEQRSTINVPAGIQEFTVILPTLTDLDDKEGDETAKITIGENKSAEVTIKDVITKVEAKSDLDKDSTEVEPITVIFGQEFKGKIAGQPYDRDYYVFDAKGGQSLDIAVKVDSSVPNNELDPIFTLQVNTGAGWSKVEDVDTDDYNDDANGLDAFYNLIVPQDAQYRIIVTSFNIFKNNQRDNNESNRYILTVK